LVNFSKRSFFFAAADLNANRHETHPLMEALTTATKSKDENHRVVHVSKYDEERFHVEQQASMKYDWNAADIV